MKRFPLKSSFRLTISLLFLILSLAAFSGCGGTSDGGSTGELTGSVTLSWEPPTTYDDPGHTPLSSSDIVGYRIYFGTSPGIYDYSLSVGNVVSFPLSDLPLGTPVYFAVTAIDVLGSESSFSAEASTVL